MRLVRREIRMCIRTSGWCLYLSLISGGNFSSRRDTSRASARRPNSQLFWRVWFQVERGTTLLCADFRYQSLVWCSLIYAAVAAGDYCRSIYKGAGASWRILYASLEYFRHEGRFLECVHILYLQYAVALIAGKGDKLTADTIFYYCYHIALCNFMKETTTALIVLIRQPMWLDKLLLSIDYIGNMTK